MRISKPPAYLWVFLSVFLYFAPNHLFAQENYIAASSVFAPFTEEVPEYSYLQKEALPANIFRVQLGLFTNAKNVEKLIEKVKSRYQLPLYIFMEERKEKECYRILIGDFNSKEAAGDFIPKLRENGLKGILKQYDRWEDAMLAAHP